ncbi:hypothetical protein Tsubulata_029743 [Turnera subulata]|uniref:Translation factor GUF1 homolog, mitochondrial n=1 Tax=Turnera subulata TaxID=218843 RepID=A0A9Q0G6L2_9ROSI|nr:hypothetical protein Tsubulata_029743 [Turnera subulata]
MVVTQTKIWLGEVLHVRFDEQLHVADLLADGQSLFEVAREIWKMLLKNGMEIRFLEAYKYEPFADRKRSGRYMPYSNVDSFLKICKILELSGIDLFSPSDVVEKRNTRKLCLRIWLEVFEKAGNFHIIAPPVLLAIVHIADQERHSDSPSTQKYDSDSDSEESDEAESNFMLQSDISNTNCSYDISSHEGSNLMSSLEVSSGLKDYCSEPFSLNLGYSKQHEDQHIEHQEEAVCLNGSTGPVHSQQSESDISSLPFIDSDIQLGCVASPEEHGVRNSSKSNLDPSLEDGLSVVGDSGDGQTPGENGFADQSTVLDSICNVDYYGENTLLDKEDRTCDSGTKASSCASVSARSNFDDEIKIGSYGVDDVEVSSIASINSVSDVVRNLDFNDHLEPEDDLKTLWLPESPNNMKLDSMKGSAAGSEYQDSSICEARRSTIDNAEESPAGKKIMDNLPSANHLLPSAVTQCNAEYVDSSPPRDNGICRTKMNSNVVHGQERELLTNQSSSPNEVRQWDQKGKCKICVVPVGNDGHGSSSPSLSQVDSCKGTHQSAETEALGYAATNDVRKQQNAGDMPKDNPDRRREDDAGAVGTTEQKSQTRPILKSVAGGTAVVGVLFLLFQLRKSGRDKAGEQGKQFNHSNPTRKEKGGEVSSKEERKESRREGAYPAEKLKRERESARKRPYPHNTKRMGVSAALLTLTHTPPHTFLLSSPSSSSPAASKSAVSPPRLLLPQPRSTTNSNSNHNHSFPLKPQHDRIVPRSSAVPVSDLDIAAAADAGQHRLSKVPISNIRNFCIIAHIDHGKSTLADKLLETTGTVHKLEAQTLANVFLALENDLEIIPVLNKIDLPGAEPDRVKREIEEVIGLDCSNAILCSAKEGIGIPEILNAIVERVPPPSDTAAMPLRALIFDSYYDPYRGVIVYFRVIDGNIKKGDRIYFMASGKVGYLAASIKSVADARVGDTITSFSRKAEHSLPGYEEATPMVFCGLFPIEANQYQELREALEKLQLNDAALKFEPESSSAMGFGFRCGFLGLLHMEIVQVECSNPSLLPEPGKIASMEEPFVKIEMFTPKDSIGGLMELGQERRGEFKELKFISENRASITYDLPLAEMVGDFFDQLKSRSKGYASMEYTFLGYRQSNLIKLDIQINGERVEPLSTIVHRDKAYPVGRALTQKLKELIPRQMFKVPIQACIGAKVIASEAISAMRKDVLAKCYGGDITRKKKLLKKQAEGKKRMKAVGTVNVPQEAFMAVLKLEKEARDSNYVNL